MARSYPAPDPFPGQRPTGWTLGGTNPDTPGWAIDTEPDNYDYDVPPDASLSQAIRPGGNDINQSGVLTAPNPFPGYPNSQPNGSSGAGGAYGHDAGDANISTRPSTSGSLVGNRGPNVLPDPNPFPGGGQIPAGVPDTTGETGAVVPRLRRDDTAGGVMP